MKPLSQGVSGLAHASAGSCLCSANTLDFIRLILGVAGAFCATSASPTLAQEEEESDVGWPGTDSIPLRPHWGAWTLPGENQLPPSLFIVSSFPICYFSFSPPLPELCSGAQVFELTGEASSDLRKGWQQLPGGVGVGAQFLAIATGDTWYYRKRWKKDLGEA